MSRHQAVRNLDYEEVLDEYDADDGGDYAEEGDQLTEEDREALAQGAEQVRALLGEGVEKVTTKQIHDALWYYYYDIEKTVDYLLTKFIVPQPKPQPKKPKEGISWSDFPRENTAVFTPPAPRPGGLLGGGDEPKVSKLQALAAARKKKSEAAKKPEEPEERAQKRLSSLTINDEAVAEPVGSDQNSLSKRQKTTRETSPTKRQPMSFAQLKQKERAKTTSSDYAQDPSAPATSDQSPPLEQTPETNSSEDYVVAKPLQPSAFAQVLCGLTSNSPQPPPCTFALPYMSSPLYNPAVFDEPSPDDIVLAAQAKAASRFDAAAAKSANKSVAPPTAKKTTKVPSQQKTNGAPAEEVKALSIDEPPPTKSKKIDVLSEFEKSKNKRSASFVVVGHVDAGKSTLMGRLLLELKFVEQHLVDRYQRQAEKMGKGSFALAWIMDQREEEREHGVTIDIATNTFETDKTRFTILDAPGHRDFVPNMIAGASQADFAVLVIDANTGAFEKGLKGQTREHALLLRSLGVQRVIVAVNKLDMVGWSEERFNEISEQVTGFMKGNGFQLKNISFIPISGLNGDNLVRRPDDTALSWYTGTTLLGALEESEPLTRALQKPFRMSISEIYRSQHSQMTISGRIESGTVQTGETLIVQPSGETAQVRNIEVDSDLQDWAVAGQNVSIGLYGIDPIHIRVGDMVSSKAEPIPTNDELIMKVFAFDHLMPMPVDVHRGRLHAAGRIQSIPAVLNKTTGALEKKKPKIVQPGKVARVVVKLDSKVPLEAGQRVVLRMGGETIAAGLLE